MYVVLYYYYVVLYRLRRHRRRLESDEPTPQQPGESSLLRSEGKHASICSRGPLMFGANAVWVCRWLIIATPFKAALYGCLYRSSGGVSCLTKLGRTQEGGYENMGDIGSKYIRKGVGPSSPGMHACVP